MPIYAYRCEACGFEKDHLQKLSEAALSICPECAQATYRKQVTAAGFQLKGNGWYVTDFKGGNKAPSAANTDSDRKQSAPPPTSTARATSPANAGPSTDSSSSTSTGKATSSADTAPASSKNTAAVKNKG
ncbi:MAG: putative regulatory protein, FmdB family [Candidatus Accumulibacter appositus]|uniref:Putative regulatory protein, FmdB family n=1 Tax=Candidatus Accumulibacter appositus TaxID=1454003 RepID=A0A011PNX1_9PROT|nr:MAG: putative regulatory protein, FmdB family [Candidatus Accumulibacter appositus]